MIAALVFGVAASLAFLFGWILGRKVGYVQALLDLSQFEQEVDPFIEAQRETAPWQ